MRSPLAALALSSFMIAAGPMRASAQAVSASGAGAQAIVNTAGSGTVHVVPDLAVFTFEITEMGLSPAEAVRRLNARVDSAARTLMRLGIPRDSIIGARRANSYRERLEPVATAGCRPRTERGPDGRTCDPFTDTTYRARETVEVRISDLDKLGAVLDSLAGRGITALSNVSFIAVSTATAQDSALRLATRAARRQAVAMAEAAGVSLGRLVFISNDAGGRMPEMVVTGAGDTGPGNQRIRNTNLAKPSVAITMNVTARWELTQLP